MGYCQDCKYCEKKEESKQKFIFTQYNTTYICTNYNVKEAANNGNGWRDVEVRPLGSCTLFQARVSLDDIGYKP